METQAQVKRGRKSGYKHLKKTKDIMSIAKKGAKHPRFKGYYFVKWRKFESATQAAKITGILTKTIINRCNNPKFKSEGYYFMPVNPNKTVNDNQLVTSE